MTFRSARRLRFGDCDPSGIAYFPSYLDMLVGVTEDFFSSIGFPWPELARDWRIATPTVRLDVTFVRPGFQGVDLDFHCRVTAVGRSSLDLRHDVTGPEPLWHAEQRLVATSSETHRSSPWPTEIRTALLTELETDHA